MKLYKILNKFFNNLEINQVDLGIVNNAKKWVKKGDKIKHIPTGIISKVVRQNKSIFSLSPYPYKDGRNLYLYEFEMADK